MSGEAQDVRELAGATIADKYVLRELVGGGAMGVVYRAEQLELGRSVAIKLLAPGLAAQHIDLFRTEALAASRINHPHAIAIFDFGVSKLVGVPYLVMEYLRGPTLADVVAQGPLPAPRATNIAAQLLSALSEAHACGVVHRDIKSDNVILELLREGDDFAKLIDFGIARLAEADDGIKGVAGTPEYMAPEQICGKPVTPACDVYAVGVLLYEMLTGSTPFAGRAVDETLRAHVELAAPALAAPCPPALSAIVASALAKDPAQRPASAGAMRDALLHAAATAELSRSCPSCGELVGAAQRFCAGCGTALRPRQQARISLKPDPADDAETRRLRASPARVPRLTLRRARAVLPFVGRERERAVLGQFMAGELGAMLALVGPRGVGKARLVTDAAARAGDAVTTVVAGPDPSGLGAPHYPIRAMLEAVLELPRRPEPATIELALARLGLDAGDAPGLAAILGVASPLDAGGAAARRREIDAAAVRALVAAERGFTRPVLTFFDVERFDAPSLRIVSVLARRLVGSGTRALMTSTSRGLTPHRTIGLEVEALTERDLAALASGRGVPAAPSPAALLAITGGLPEALEHLLAWLDHGHDAAHAPRALVDLVADRLRPLLPAARRLLQAIAVRGTTCPRAELGEDEMVLDELVLEGLVTRDGEELLLGSDLLRDVVRASTPVDVAHELHAQALARLPADASPLLRAHHAAGARAPDAIACCLAAGAYVAERSDDAAAVRWYARAAELANELSANESTVDASIALAGAVRRMGQVELATEVLTQAALLDPTAGQRAAVARERALLAVGTADAGDPERLLRRAIEQSRRAGARGELVTDCYIALADLLAREQRRDEALAVLEDGLRAITDGALFAARAAPAGLAELSERLVALRVGLPDLEDARDTARAALACARRLDLPAAVMRLEASCAAVEVAAGHHAAALGHLDRAIATAEGLGDRSQQAALRLERARVARERGDEVTDTLALARALAVAIGDDAQVRACDRAGELAARAP